MYRYNITCIYIYSLVSIWTDAGGLVVLGAVVVGAVVEGAVAPTHWPASTLVHEVPVEAGEGPVLGALALYEQRALLDPKFLQVLGVRVDVVAAAVVTTTVTDATNTSGILAIAVAAVTSVVLHRRRSGCRGRGQSYCLLLMCTAVVEDDCRTTATASCEAAAAAAVAPRRLAALSH